MPAKSYYELLDLPASASSDDIKKAFRQQIARYHPDKVQHLGKEFQDMAADRAAELTEAYRILSNDASRAEYDRTLGTVPSPASSPTSAPAPSASQAPPPSQSPRAESYSAPGGRPSISRWPAATHRRGWLLSSTIRPGFQQRRSRRGGRRPAC